MFVRHLILKIPRLMPALTSLQYRRLHDLKKDEYKKRTLDVLSNKFGEKEREAPISFQLLAEIVGKKYYQHNDEIRLPDDHTVRVYDKNNKLLGEMLLSLAKERAGEQGLDIVLKTLSTIPPVVQIAPYRADLIKSFYQKYTHFKTAEDEVEDKDFTVTEINKQIDMSDLRNKISHIRQLVTKKNAAVKVIVKVDPLNKIDVAKANFLLQNVADQLAGLGKIRKRTDVQEFPEFSHCVETKEEALESLDIEAQIERETEPGEIDLEDSHKKRKREKAEPPVKDNFRLAYVSVEVVPRTNKKTAASLEWILEKMGSVEDILKKVTEKRTAPINKTTKDEEKPKKINEIIREAQTKAQESTEKEWELAPKGTSRSLYEHKLAEKELYYISKALWRKARRDDTVRFGTVDIID